MSGAMTIASSPTFRRLSFAECKEYATELALSGYFTDAKSAVQAFAKVVCGQELGIEPFQAMTNIHIIQGKPTLSSTMLASLVQRSGWASYHVVSQTENECEIEFTVHAVKNVSRFSMEDAKQAGLLANPTWQKYKPAMLFARAMSQGVRWFCPGILGGVAYVEGELDAVVMEPKNITPKVIAPKPAAIPAPEDAGKAWSRKTLFEVIEIAEKEGNHAVLCDIMEGVIAGHYASREIKMTEEQFKGCEKYIRNIIGLGKPAESEGQSD